MQSQKKLEDEAGENAEIVRIIGTVKKTEERFSTKDVTESFNTFRDEQSRWKKQTMGYAIRRLNFKNARMQDGTQGWKWDEKLWFRLADTWNLQLNEDQLKERDKISQSTLNDGIPETACPWCPHCRQILSEYQIAVLKKRFKDAWWARLDRGTVADDS
jgi:hypothetical protein